MPLSMRRGIGCGKVDDQRLVVPERTDMLFVRRRQKGHEFHGGTPQLALNTPCWRPQLQSPAL